MTTSLKHYIESCLDTKHTSDETRMNSKQFLQASEEDTRREALKVHVQRTLFPTTNWLEKSYLEKKLSHKSHAY